MKLQIKYNVDTFSWDVVEEASGKAYASAYYYNNKPEIEYNISDVRMSYPEYEDFNMYIKMAVDNACRDYYDIIGG